jgi:uncharacterized protein
MRGRVTRSTHARRVLVASATGLLLSGGGPRRAQTVRPQDPVPPIPYTEIEVSYASGADGTTLAGTLTLPEGDGPFPAALLMSGAGPQNRDYEVFDHRPFRVLSDHLARAGIAVLRMDDRGVGGSGGDASLASVADIMGDLEAGLAFLGSHERVEAGAVGIVAHSEGGRVAPEAAAASTRTRFLVLLAPPVLRARDQARVQAIATVEVSDDPLVEVQAALVARIRETVRDEPDPATATSLVFDDWEEWLDTLPADQAQTLRALRSRDPFVDQVEQLVVALATPWNRELYDLDSTPSLSAVQMPVLALYGDLDRQAPPRWNIPILQGTLTGHPDATIRVLPGLNHFFQHAETGLPAEIQAIDETLAPEAMAAVSGWINARFTP